MSFETMSTEPLLDIRALCAGYGDSDVLRGIDLNVEKGEIVAVLGSNGVGKSTLNRAISGIVRARSGAILFEGVAIDHEKPAAIVARGLIHVPEGRRIFPNLSVRENLDLGSYRRAASRRAANRDRVFAIFPRLFERRAQRAGTLSGGEQQMLAIGRALMTNPKLLILDEATEGLAPLIRAQIWACLARLKAEGQAILLVDKHIDALTKIADRHVVIEKGHVVWTGGSQSLAADRELQRRYLQA